MPRFNYPVGLPIMTTTQRNALSTVVAGDMIINSTRNNVTQWYDGTRWRDLGRTMTTRVYMARSLR